MGARKHPILMPHTPEQLAQPGAVVVRIVQSATPEEAQRRAEGLARIYQRGLERSRA